MTHRTVAEDCWRLIKAMVDSVDDSDLALFNELDAAAINLIEMACDSAVESRHGIQALHATALKAIIADMQALSDAADEANGTSDYQVRLVSLGLVARHFLRSLAATKQGPSHTFKGGQRGGGKTDALKKEGR